MSGTFFSRTCKYAIQGLGELARHPPGTLHNIKEIAQQQEIPSATLAKAFKKLVKAGLVESISGRHGGFKLIRSAQDINLSEIKRIIDGELSLRNASDQIAVEEEALWFYPKRWLPIYRQIQEQLELITLADLVKPSIELDLNQQNPKNA